MRRRLRDQSGQASAEFLGMIFWLVTTLLNPHTHPAAELIRLYHQRWEIETAYLELKSSILAGRVLRARTPDGIDQEIHALLIVYQLLRTAMTDATDSRPGLDPDRASFTTALNTALVGLDRGARCSDRARSGSV